MSITPRDIVEIQSAIDRYEKKFPHKPSPTPAEALAWKAGNTDGSHQGLRVARVLSLVFGRRTRPG
jgi:hypothetical protein